MKKMRLDRKNIEALLDYPIIINFVLNICGNLKRVKPQLHINSSAIIYHVYQKLQQIYICV